MAWANLRARMHQSRPRCQRRLNSLGPEWRTQLGQGLAPGERHGVVSSSPKRLSGGAVGFAIRLHETVGMGDGDTVDATGTTGASLRVDEIVSVHGARGGSA